MSIGNIAGDSITYSYDSDYNSQTGVYTDPVSFGRANQGTFTYMQKNTIIPLY